jgi:[1-hydroxy-2-(trimethylamino)ethyl]phosphonate dioxygenase
MPVHAVIREIAALFAQRGDSLYGGEAVTQEQHALQAAWFARQAGAGSAQVAAALLHDIGHLLHDLPDDAPEQGLDDVHEDRAAQFLRRHFPPAVVEPVRLHVAAKRYLCATRPGYLESLSAPSLLSLELQGGVMQGDEIAEFEALPYGQEAVQLRLWDDLAKDPSLVTPSLADFLPDLEVCLLPG